MLKRILGVEIPCASNLPEEFLLECKKFDYIPLLTLENISFVEIPPTIIDLKTNDCKPFRKLLRSKGITNQYDTTELLRNKGIIDQGEITELLKNKGITGEANITEKLLRNRGMTNEDDIMEILKSMENTDEDEITEGLITQMKHNHLCNRIPPFYPFVWIPQKIATDIKTMETPFERFGKKSFIHSLATFIPINEDWRIRNTFFTQLIAILLKRVKYDVNTKLEYSYYISDKIKLNLFIAVIG